MSNPDHYTPDELADRLVSDAAAAGPIRSVCDLACGDGALLAAVRRAFPEAKLYGCEIDPEAAQAARERLPGAVIETGDGLAYEPPERPDLVLINPPFSVRYSPEVRKRWKLKGHCDLAVAFMLRGAEISDRVSVIATNSIRSGASRRCGLARLLAEGWEIYRAWTDYPWPGRAKVTVVDVHLRNLIVFDGLPDGSPVSSRLDELPELEPRRLYANRGLMFQGLKLDVARYVRPGPQQPGALPFLGGKDINTNPTQAPSRHCTEPERYRREAPRLCAALAGVDRYLAISNVSKHVCFSFHPTDQVFQNSLNVAVLDAYSQFAILQSRVHTIWARLQGSTMRGTLRYKIADCFETFPFPEVDPTARFPSLELIGKKLYERRAAFMVEHQIGLTKLYNQLHDLSDVAPGVVELRALHEELDNAVLDAYGWDNFRAPPYGADTERFNELVIERLMVLNSLREGV